MRADTSVPRKTLQACKACGAGSPLDAHFCQDCRAILPVARGADYFQFLGLPRRLRLDPADLDRRFRDLSRQFHPDFFYNAPPAQRRASLERSSFLNDAYRTLKQPIARAEYLLQLEGMAPANEREASAKVPAALLEEVFALNEELDEIRSAREAGAPAEQLRARLAAARAPIEHKRDEHERELRQVAEEWDAIADGEPPARTQVLERLRDLILERNYINNLLATIERESQQT
jgi:molecular chaperone HscB